MDSGSDVEKYYDEFSAYEVSRGVNLRHFHIFNELKRSGIQKNHSVLEIGCGIGQLTGLLKRYLRKGKIVSTDISPASIAIAKRRMGSSSDVEFVVTDMTDFTYPDLFDFIVLPDVLEHIPKATHTALFGHLSKLMKPDAKLIIHIPHPKYILFDELNHPEKLQIIDQQITADELMANTYPHGLMLEKYEAYPLFNQQKDYVYIVFSKDYMPGYQLLPKWKVIQKKSMERVRYILSLIRG